MSSTLGNQSSVFRGMIASQMKVQLPQLTTSEPANPYRIQDSGQPKVNPWQLLGANTSFGPPNADTPDPESLSK